LPDTGISGVYEVCYATDDLDFTTKYFADLGFREVANASYSAKEAEHLYGHVSALRSYRFQNGDIDSHGLLRVLVWDKYRSEGVGLAPPRSIGQRISVMKCNDIYRLKDIFENASSEKTKWNVTQPISDDLFDLDNGEKDFFNRPVIVRENAVYGSFFNHIFFQRYGYHIEGYGTIDNETILQTSEFTHHDFFINASKMDEISYLSTALGLKAEEAPKIDSAEQKGPKAVFQMRETEGHWYQGFVSPNNICGKLKMFIPTTATNDYSQKQNIGSKGVTMHSFWTDKLDFVYDLVEQHNLSPSNIMDNEFGEQCFNFTGPGGCSWQIIQKTESQHKPKKELEFTLTKN